MAVNVGTIEAILRLKDQFSAGMKNAAKNAEAAGKRLGNVSKRATGVGKSLSLGVTLPLVAAASAAVKFSQDMNAGMANVASLIPNSTARVIDLKKTIQELAIETGSSTSDMADGLYNVISALGDTADTEKILEINARAAAAGLATVTDAINLTSGVTKGYGDISAVATQKASDLAFTTVKLGQTTFPELAVAMGRVIPLASKLNLSQEELFATFATLTGVTGKTSMVSTQYAAVLTGLMKATPAMSASIEELGFAGSESMLKTLGLKDSLDALIGTTDGSAEAVGKLFGSQEALVAIFALTGAQAETYEDKLSQLMDVVGATDEAFVEQTQGINAAGFAWKQLKVEMTVVAQELGDELQPIFTDIVAIIQDDIVPAIREWVKWFGDLSPEAKKMALQVAALITVLPVMILMFGQIGSAVSGVIAMAGAIHTMTAGTVLATTATKLFTVAFYGIPIIGWIAGIVALGIAIYVFRDSIRDLIAQGINKLLNGIDSLKVKFGLMTFAEAEAAKTARSLAEDLGDITLSAEVLRDKLGEAGVTGSVKDLHAAMANLGGVVGGLNEDEMKTIALRAIELREAGEELTPELERVADQFERQVDEASEAAKELKATEAAAKRLAQQQAKAADEMNKFNDEVEEVVDGLTGRGLIRQVKLLDAAHRELTPEQRANGRVMEELAKQVEELEENGAELTDSLGAVADASRQTTRDIKELWAAVDKAKEINDIMRASTAADMPARVDKLQVAWTNLSTAHKANTQTLRWYMAAVEAAEKAGGVFDGTLGDLDTTVVDLEDATEALRKRVDALKKSIGPEQLQLEAEALNITLADMTVEGDLTAHAMEELGKQALALRDKGVVLEGNLNDLADAAEDAKTAADDLAKTWEETLSDLASAFEDLANISGGAFGGIAKSIGTIIGAMQVAKTSADTLKGSIGKIKSGDMLGGVASLATGIMGIVGALDAATASGNKFERVLGGIMSGAQAGMAIGGGIGAVIGGAIGGIVGWIRGNGPSAMEKEARNLVATFEDSVISRLNSTQLDEARGRRWAQVVIGVRDAYLQNGRSAAEAEAQVQRLWDAVKNGGPEAVKLVVSEIQKVIDANDALDLIIASTVTGLQALVDQGKQTGELMPAHLEPYLETLREAGLLTQEDQNLLMQMADEAEVDWRAMKESAERYGISLSDLGPAFNRKQLQDAAKAIVADWEILNQEGVNTKAVLEGMSESVQGLMDKAFAAGVDIPASMKPVITQMIDQGLLTDANGDKLTDMSQLNFAEPIEAKFNQLIDKIGELIDRLTGENGITDSVKEVGDSVENDIPDTIKIDIGYNVQEFPGINMPDIRIPVGWDMPDFPNLPGGAHTGGQQHGTGGRFVDFGQGTLTMLHGREAVVPESRADSFSAAHGGKSEEALLEEVSGLRIEIQNLPIHIRDAILLTK